MSHGENGGLKSVKKSQVLFEWPLSIQTVIPMKALCGHEGSTALIQLTGIKMAKPELI
jgi:hypothetical protein